MNWADQQPGESRAAWKERTFAFHYGMGGTRMHEMFERHGRMPQAGDSFNFTFAPSAGPTYSGRSDGYGTYAGRQWFGDEGQSRAERALNTIEDWDQLGVELPELIMVPTPSDEGIFVITRMEA